MKTKGLKKSKPQMKTKQEEMETQDSPEIIPEIKKEPEDKGPKINRNARLIIRNVSFKATEDSLKEHFQPYGDIHEVKLLKKPDGKLVGCAFVHFKNVPMAKKALLYTNMKPFLGRPISVDWAVAKDRYMQFLDKQRLQMLDDVKKEDSDSDMDNDKVDINLVPKIKSESDGSDMEEDKPKVESDTDNEEEEDDDEDEDDDDDDEAMSDDESEISPQYEKKRVKLNDAEDGCTVFITNLPFNVDNYQLTKFVEKFSPVKYALVCVDKLTEHSRGTGFVKFTSKEDADKFLSLPAQELRLEGQTLLVKPALKKETLQTDTKKQPKDNRNLYLVKEGVVVAGTKAAVGVSASDMSKRLTLERTKTQMLKNLNRFVSRYRLVVANLPPYVDDSKLRSICANTVGARATITEARVMKHLKAPLLPNGKHASKEYGFVMFMRHEDALACLRTLNNNPDIFNKNNRPIVSFSIEDRAALNARKKRLEKSLANNPLAQQKVPTDTSNKSCERKWRRKGGKNGNVKRGKPSGPSDEPGKFVKPQIESAAYSGLASKEGTQHNIRNNHKLKMQADIHKQNVKLEKKRSKRSLKLKLATRERIKQPKQKVNKIKPTKGSKKNKF